MRNETANITNNSQINKEETTEAMKSTTTSHEQEMIECNDVIKTAVANTIGGQIRMTADEFVKLEYHEYANFFPAISDSDFRRFKEDIRKNGLNNPIIIHEGTVLDGRNRHKACCELLQEGKITSRKVKVKLLSKGKDPFQYVFSANLHRRHLNESQRALIAARVAPVFRNEAEIRETAGRKGCSGAPVHCNKLAGEMLNVSSSSVSSAIRLLEDGVEEIIGLVDKGLIRINFARKLSGLSDEQFETFQKKVMEKIEDHAMASVTRDVEKVEKKIERINTKEKHSVADKCKLKKLEEEKKEVEESIENYLKDLNNIQDYTKLAKSTYEGLVTADSKYAVILRLMFTEGKLIVNYSTVTLDEETAKKQIIKEFENKEDAVNYATEMNSKSNSEMDKVLKDAREQIQSVLEGVATVAA